MITAQPANPGQLSQPPQLRPSLWSRCIGRLRLVQAYKYAVLGVCVTIAAVAAQTSASTAFFTDHELSITNAFGSQALDIEMALEANSPSELTLDPLTASSSGILVGKETPQAVAYRQEVAIAGSSTLCDQVTVEAEYVYFDTNGLQSQPAYLGPLTSLQINQLGNSSAFTIPNPNAQPYVPNAHYSQDQHWLLYHFSVPEDISQDLFESRCNLDIVTHAWQADTALGEGYTDTETYRLSLTLPAEQMTQLNIMAFSCNQDTRLQAHNRPKRGETWQEPAGCTPTANQSFGFAQEVAQATWVDTDVQGHAHAQLATRRAYTFDVKQDSESELEIVEVSCSHLDNAFELPYRLDLAEVQEDLDCAVYFAQSNRSNKQERVTRDSRQSRQPREQECTQVSAQVRIVPQDMQLPTSSLVFMPQTLLPIEVLEYTPGQAVASQTSLLQDHTYMVFIESVEQQEPKVASARLVDQDSTQFFHSFTQTGLLLNQDTYDLDLSLPQGNRIFITNTAGPVAVRGLVTDVSQPSTVTLKLYDLTDWVKPIQQASTATLDFCDADITQWQVMPVVDASWQVDKPWYTLDQDTSFVELELSSAMVINEIQYDPAGADDRAMPHGEYVELYNRSSQRLDLAGWSLHDKEGGIWEITADTADATLITSDLGESVVPGRQWLTVYRDARLMALNNTNPDEVTLIDSQGITRDHVAYTPEPEQNLGRYPDGAETWSLQLATPTRANADTSAHLSPLLSLHMPTEHSLSVQLFDMLLYDSAEYMLSYSRQASGSAKRVQEAVVGRVDPTTQDLVLDDITLGSCSADAACSFHQQLEDIRVSVLLTGSGLEAISVESALLLYQDLHH